MAMVVMETDGFESGRLNVNESLGRGRGGNSVLPEVGVLVTTEEIV